MSWLLFLYPLERFGLYNADIRKTMKFRKTFVINFVDNRVCIL